jgi:hypothetical protein
VEIFQPLPNQPFGPGFQWRAQTSFVGPIELGSYYEATGLEATGEQLLGSSVLVSQSSLELGVLGQQRGASSTTWLLHPQHSSTPAGAAARLQVTLRSPSNAILDTTTIPIVWNLDAQEYVVSNILQAPTVEGGFTAADRAELQVVHASVVSSIPLTTTVPDLAELGIDTLQAGPPVELLGTSADFLLTGRGSIDRPSGSAGIYAYGCRWLIETAPAGLGKLQGVIDEFEQRIAQFVLIKGGAGGFEYADQVVEDHHGSGQLTWGIPFPKRLEFSILPGVTLRFRWLLFLQAP